MRNRTVRNLKYDVVVVGGGLSGICAALAAARNGARTAIIQSRPVFGGCSSSEVRMHICGANCHARKKDLAETGIIEELLLENKSVNPTFSFSIWDMVLWGKIKMQDNLDAYMNTSMDDVKMDGIKIASIICRQSSTELVLDISASIFIDATGNASLGYYSGADYRTGSEPSSEFNEKDAPETYSPYIMGESIMFSSLDTGHPVNFRKPQWARSFTEEDLAERAHGNTTVGRGDNGIVEEYEVSSGYWWIEHGGKSGNIIEETEDIKDELYSCVFGVWDHIKNYANHGADNYAIDWVGVYPGMRESRRLDGDYILNENDVLSNRVFEDAVAYGGWPMDMHEPAGILEAQQPTKHYNFPGCYSIPYRCYYSRSISNLMMAGRDISVSRMAFGSSRVMATCAVGGQAAGTAAAMAVRHSCGPRDIGRVHIEELQQTLLRDDCYIPGCTNTDVYDKARNAVVSASGYSGECRPELVLSGVTRGVDENGNCWESLPLSMEKAFLLFRLGATEPVSQIRVVFDPDLNSEIMVTMTRRVQAKEVTGMPPVLVRDYSVSIIREGNEVFRKDFRDNNKRLCVLDVPEGICGDEVKLEIHSTYGYECARVFEVRIY